MQHRYNTVTNPYTPERRPEAASNRASGMGSIWAGSAARKRTIPAHMRGCGVSSKHRARRMPHRYSTCLMLRALPAWIRTRSVKDGSKRYDVIYRRGGRYFPVEHAGTFRTRRDANTRRDTVSRWLAAALDPKTELARAITEGVLVGDVAQRWLDSRRRITDTTRDNYQRRVVKIREDFPAMTVQRLTWQDVQAWVARLETSYRPGTVSLFLQVLRQALDFHGGENVARDRRVEVPRTPARVVEPPTADEVAAAFAQLHPRYRPVCVLLEQTGLRVSEAVALRPDDLDRAGLRLLVRVSKTGQPRWVPCPAWLLDAVALPFDVGRQQTHNALKAACRAANVRLFGPHQLRHRRGSLWHLKGVPPVQAAAWLGHSPVMHLRTYAHVMPIDEVPAQVLASLLIHA